MAIEDSGRSEVIPPVLVPHSFLSEMRDRLLQIDKRLAKLEKGKQKRDRRDTTKVSPKV